MWIYERKWQEGGIIEHGEDLYILCYGTNGKLLERW